MKIALGKKILITIGESRHCPKCKRRRINKTNWGYECRDCDFSFGGWKFGRYPLTLRFYLLPKVAKVPLAQNN